METRKKKSDPPGEHVLQSVLQHNRKKKEKRRLEAVEKTESAASPATKRQKKCPADDLICPISLELPFQPVTAKDGRVYEKTAIEEWIKKAGRHQVRSPYTNEMMGKELLPSPLIKNHIETLVETGVITGDLANKWKEKVQQKKDMEELLKQAKGGDANKMVWVAYYYGEGENGFKLDLKESYMWFDKARKAGSFEAMYEAGNCLLRGRGVQKSRSQGIMYVTRAAENGEAMACGELGIALSKGAFGLAVNKDDAIYWFKKALSVKGAMRLAKKYKHVAEQKLEELESS